MSTEDLHNRVTDLAKEKPVVDTRRKTYVVTFQSNDLSELSRVSYLSMLGTFSEDDSKPFSELVAEIHDQGHFRYRVEAGGTSHIEAAVEAANSLIALEVPGVHWSYLSCVEKTAAKVGERLRAQDARVSTP